MTEAKVMPAPTTGRFTRDNLKEFVPNAHWSSRPSTLSKLTVSLADVSYAAHHIHRQHVCSLHVINHADKDSCEDIVGEDIGTHQIVGFTVWLPLDYFLANDLRSGYYLTYGLRRFFYNLFRKTYTLTELIKVAESRHPDLFGKHKKELWRIINIYDQAHCIRVHIPLP